MADVAFTFGPERCNNLLSSQPLLTNICNLINLVPGLERIPETFFLRMCQIIQDDTQDNKNIMRHITTIEEAATLPHINHCAPSLGLYADGCWCAAGEHNRDIARLVYEIEVQVGE